MADYKLNRWLMIACLAWGAAMAVAAQTSTAAPTPSPTATPAAADTGEADFFGADTPEATAKPVDSAYKENFVKQQPIQFGGNFKLVMSAGLDYFRDFSGWTGDYLFSNMAEIPHAGYPNYSTDKGEESSIDLQGSLYFSARPTNSLRIYGKTKITYPFSTVITNLVSGDTVTIPNITIWELFADFNIDEKVFFRAGKQMVKWGASAYAFWSPADVISLGQIDINDRGQDLEGPFAIKANIPFGDNNLDFYVTAASNTSISSVTDLGYAMRAKFLVGGWELGAGAVNQKSQDWKFVATASGSLWKFNIFGEALVNRTANGYFLVKDSTVLGGYRSVSSRSDWFFSGTAGISYANSDIYLDTVMVQYYFNGMGYAESFSRNLYLNELVAIQGASTWFGMHYLAVAAEESFVHDSKFHLLVTWVGNLNDGSGFVKPAVNFDITDEIILGLFSTFYYGAENTQFRGAVTADGYTVHQPRFKIGLTLTLGTGNF